MIDRYVLFLNNQFLVDYYRDLIHTVGDISYRLTSENLFEKPVKGFPEKHILYNELSNFISRWKQPYLNLNSKETLVIPTIQCGNCGIRQDQEFTTSLLHHDDWKYHISSGYFNFTPEYEKLILSKNAEIFTSAPQV